jgi:hypothetical protein
MSQILSGACVTLFLAFIGAIVAFFKAKEEVKDKIHNLELKIKDLEYKDQQQQQIIDTIPNVFSIFNRLLEQKGGGDGNK